MDARTIPAVILAAGQSTRMPGNKLLAHLSGQPMVRRTVRIYAGSAAAPVIVVVGHDSRRVLKALEDLAFQICFNRDYKSGKASSIIAALEAVPAGVQGILFAQADMPFVRSETVDLLVASFAGAESVLIPTFKGKAGSPKVFGAEMFADLRQLVAEQTGNRIVKARPDKVSYIEVEDPGVLMDLDCPEDFTRYREYENG